MSIIKTVTYQATVSTYGGCNESVKWSAEIEAGEELETVLKDLKTKAHEHLNDSEKYGEYANGALELQKRFRQIQKQVADAESYWTSVTQFMKTQGIKSDFPDFPKLSVNNFYLQQKSSTVNSESSFAFLILFPSNRQMDYYYPLLSISLAFNLVLVFVLLIGAIPYDR